VVYAKIAEVVVYASMVDAEVYSEIAGVVIYGGMVGDKVDAIKAP